VLCLVGSCGSFLWQLALPRTILKIHGRFYS
jgi:hypothetical protein